MSLPFFKTRTPAPVSHRSRSPQQEPLDLSMAARGRAPGTPGTGPAAGVLGAVDALAGAATAGLFAPPAAGMAGPDPSAPDRTGPSLAARYRNAVRRLDPQVKAARAAERARLRAAARAQAPEKPPRPRPSRMTTERLSARALAQANLAQARKAARVGKLTNRQRRQIDSGMEPAAFGLYIRSITALNKVDEKGRPLYRNPDGSANLTAHDKAERRARESKQRLQAEAEADAGSPDAPANTATPS